ncbi:hypothetical protein [Microbacterium sp. P05]|uniref:glycosyltransferase family protein n=1 Tax=Microbacterium sp. P05 TaxID=3366948 RepID=UPI003746C854
MSPLWDAPAYMRNHPDRVGEPGGPVGSAWRRRAQESLPFGAEALPAAPGWTSLRAAITDAAAAAASLRDGDVGSSDSGAQAELIAAFGENETDFDESLADIAGYLARGGAAALAVTDRHPEVWSQIAFLARCQPRLRAILRPQSSTAAAINEVVLSSQAEVIILRGPNQSLDAETAATLAERAAPGRAVAPLWLDSDGTIAAAGTAKEGRILAGHPAEDAQGIAVENVITVPALSGPTFAVPAAVIRGPLPHEATGEGLIAMLGIANVPTEVHTDLVARSRTPAPPPPSVEVEGSSRALLERAGWEQLEHGQRPRLRRPGRSVRLENGQTVPALRWALKTAAPAGPRAEWWGDTHFARGLAAALRRLGQEVVIDAYPARNRATTRLDDVTVALRGPEPIDPPETGISVLWVISHPDEQDRQSVGAFDIVFAASQPWASSASREFGKEIRPLLQCTDATRFHPSGRARGRDIVFVGTARGIFRPSVVAPIRAGIPVQVFGPDWREWIPASAIAGTGVPNADLPALYEQADVVLNDHWPAMKEQGFIANRPYDVVAAGGRVISDDVEGIRETFEGAVVTYRDVDELIALLRGDIDAAFPDQEELSRISAMIRSRDSFDARARTLLHAVIEAI